MLRNTHKKGAPDPLVEAPELRMTLPPLPALLVPRETENAPVLPVVEAPVARVMSPLLPPTPTHQTDIEDADET